MHDATPCEARRQGRNRILCAVAILAALAFLIQGTATRATAAPSAKPAKAAQGAQAIPGMNKIEHVIWIIQENHSFDNYFGTYPNADGLPPSTCLPKMPGSKDCVKPFHPATASPTTWPTALTSTRRRFRPT